MNNYYDNIQNLYALILESKDSEITRFKDIVLKSSDKRKYKQDVIELCESYFCTYFQYSFLSQTNEQLIANYNIRLRRKESNNVTVEFKLLRESCCDKVVINFFDGTEKKIALQDTSFIFTGNINDLKSITIDRITHYADKVVVPSVLYGKNGWLFLINDRNNSLSQYLGRVSLSDQALKKWKDFIKELSRYKNAQILLAPNKETIYNRYYPFVGFNNQILTSIQNIEPRSRIVNNPTQHLSKYELAYCKTDTHWTYLGALEALKNTYPAIPFKNFKLTIGQKTGDIGCKLVPPLSSEFVYYDFDSNNQYAIKLIDNGLTQDGHFSIFVNKNALVDATIVLFGDSFSRFLYPFISETFKKSIFLRTAGSIINEVLLYEKPDYVLVERAERFCLNAPDVYDRIQDCPQMIKNISKLRQIKDKLTHDLLQLDQSNPFLNFIKSL